MDAMPTQYLYNAHGHALSGRIDRPFEDLIEVQAGTSLPITGGYGSSRADHFRYKEIISFKAAYTQVSGSRKDGSYTTLVSSTIEGLNILDVITADRIVARLSSQHTPAEAEAHIVLSGSQFENLRISGCPVQPEFRSDLFLRLDTFAAVRKELETSAEFRRIALDPYQTGQPQPLPDHSGVVLCSLVTVKDISATCPGVTRLAHGYVIPQFGRVFLGEVICEHRKRTLTMVRAELGSPIGGCVTALSVQGNGTSYPPPP
jgi:hypothetical protein